MTGGREKRVWEQRAPGRGGGPERAALPCAPGARPPALPHQGAVKPLGGWASCARDTPATAGSSFHPPSPWLSSPPRVSCGASAPAERACWAAAAAAAAPGSQ